MKKFKCIVLCFVISIIVMNCSDSINNSDNEADPITDYGNEIANLFPTQVGATLTYSVDTLNMKIQTFENIGNRKLIISGESLVDGNEYFIANQLYNLTEKNFELNSKFRLTDNSVLFLTDTNRVSESIPDSLEGQLTINIDPEIKLLEYPLIKNKSWPVIKASVDFGAFKFNILAISGEYIDTETLVLDGYPEPLESERVKYKLDINIPELDNPFLSEISTYYANAWFVKGKGIVKLEGCSLFINPLSGMHMDFGDSNKVSRHTLISSN